MKRWLKVSIVVISILVVLMLLIVFFIFWNNTRISLNNMNTNLDNYFSCISNNCVDFYNSSELQGSLEYIGCWSDCQSVMKKETGNSLSFIQNEKISKFLFPRKYLLIEQAAEKFSDDSTFSPEDLNYLSNLFKEIYPN